MNLCDLRAIQDLLERHGFRFSKSMGQNFLIDESIPQDRRRSNMTTARRWFVVQVDSEQLSDPALLDITAREAARLLCRRVPEPTDTWLTQRGRLRETLLGAGHVHM